MEHCLSAKKPQRHLMPEFDKIMQAIGGFITRQTTRPATGRKAV